MEKTPAVKKARRISRGEIGELAIGHLPAHRRSAHPTLSACIEA
jgi:hypothetical protein